jgi:hypothetical protein
VAQTGWRHILGLLGEPEILAEVFAFWRGLQELRRTP